MASGMGLFMGNCSGHGFGSGASHHPGLGGGTISPCPHTPLATQIKPVNLNAMDAVTKWPPLAQLPLGVGLAAASKVVVNGKIPMVDQDILTPHPTPTMHTTTSVGKECITVLNTPAWWCTTGTAGGREPAIGHSRKVFSTVKTVFIGKKRACRFGDKLGDGTTAFPCNSVVTGCSKNVFIEMSGG